jgi:murein DD-endopeptidase MepM/ murein hydrolase activator NlpD
MPILQTLGAEVSPSLAARVLAPFPVAGPASFSDDWHAVRTAPSFHLHEGVDIFAARGTPVVAAAAGVVRRIVPDSAVGGRSLQVVTADGTYFYYAHLNSFARFLFEGTPVAVGDVLGAVGTSGNAEGTPPHLHFEIHPVGGPAVPPVPYLDGWLEQARARLGLASGLRSDVPVTPDLEAAALASPDSGPLSTVRRPATRSLRAGLAGTDKPPPPIDPELEPMAVAGVIALVAGPIAVRRRRRLLAIAGGRGPAGASPNHGSGGGHRHA